MEASRIVLELVMSIKTMGPEDWIGACTPVFFGSSRQGC